MALTDYRALAVKAHQEADAATLANVRDRCLRAEAAWLEMARRQDLTETARARREADAAAAAADRLLPQG